MLEILADPYVAIGPVPATSDLEGAYCPRPLFHRLQVLDIHADPYVAIGPVPATSTFEEA